VHGKHTANCCSGTDSKLTAKRKRGMYCCSCSISRWGFALCMVWLVPVLVYQRSSFSKPDRRERGYRQE
jgi:hypothetical protein